jgi:hypothetical protein
MKKDCSIIKADTRINFNNTLKRALVDIIDNDNNTPDSNSNLWEDVMIKSN